MNLGQLGSHGGSQFGVQVGQGLVKQEDRGLPHDGTPQSNSLLLTAGKSLGLPIQQMGDVQNSGGFFHTPLNLFLGHLAQLQTKRHVVEHRHMGVQSVVLEHHGNIPVLGCHIVHDPVSDEQLAFGDLFEACDHTQSGGLAASGRTDKNDEFLILDLQAEVGYGGDPSGVFLVHVSERQSCHNFSP